MRRASAFSEKGESSVSSGTFREHGVQSFTDVVDGTTGECFVIGEFVT